MRIYTQYTPIGYTRYTDGKQRKTTMYGLLLVLHSSKAYAPKR